MESVETFPPGEASPLIEPNRLAWRAISIVLAMVLSSFMSLAAAFNTASYFPLTSSATWTYRYTSGDGSMTVRSVLGTGTINGAPTWVLVDSLTGTQSYFSNDASGVRQHGKYSPSVSVSGVGTVSASETDTPPQVFLQPDATLGVPVTSRGTATVFYSSIGTFPLSYTVTATPVAFEPVATTSLSFANALRVHVVSIYTGTITANGHSASVSISEDETVWLVPTLGAVKVDDTTTSGTKAAVTTSLELYQSPLLNTQPNPFSFDAVSNVAPGSTVTSSPTVITGINFGVNFNVSGGLASINGGPFLSSGTVLPGDAMRVQVVAAATPATAVAATVQIGNTPTSFGMFRVITAIPQGTSKSFYVTRYPGFGTCFGGDVLLVAAGGGNTLDATGSSSSGLSFTATMPIPPPIGGTQSFVLSLTPTPGTSLVPGLYDPGSVVLQMPNRISGRSRFQILDAVYDNAGTVQSFAADAAMDCGPPANTQGTIIRVRYNSSVPLQFDTGMPPAPFAFAPVTDAAFYSVISSAAATITGLAAPAPIGITGGSYSINGGAFTTAAGTVAAGDRVTVQVTTSGDSAAQVCATVTISELSAPFCATTSAFVAPAPFSFAAATNVSFNQSIVSSPLAVATGTSVPISISGGTYSINGGAYTAIPATVRNGDSVTVRLVSPGTSATQGCATLTLGGVAGQFCATTVAYAAPNANRIIPLLLDD